MTNNFTGLLVQYEDGTRIEEKNYFYSDKLKKECATNWAEINLDKIESLELHHSGFLKVKISKKDHPYITPSDWFFSHTGIADMGKTKPKTISRNIGYKKESLLYVSSVEEETGTLSVNIRKT